MVPAPTPPQVPTVSPSLAPPSAVALAASDDEWFATGFLDFPIAWNDNEELDAGFSMYVAAWPFQQTYPGPDHQTGLPSTWLVPSNVDDVPGENYSTIEGGLGWWGDTRFATETPKFIMGGVARNFSAWANGPGAGSSEMNDGHRDWSDPGGKYGVAQLSPSVLWAPDGLNLEQGTNGELFGYGYHPLPIIDTQLDTAGQNIETGNRSWTLFLSAGNFQGPVSFFVPNFFSEPALSDPSVEGAFFDSSPLVPHRSVAMETQVIPAAHAIDDNGVSYARITRTQFPMSDDDSSIILNRVASYSDDALWNPARDWFGGGVEPSGQLDAAHSSMSEFDPIDARDASSYVLLHEGLDQDQEYPIDWASLADVDVSDPHTFRYRWNLDLVERDGDQFLLPEYYRLDGPGPGGDIDGERDGPVWTPVLESDVPDSTGLRSHEFVDLGVRNDGDPYLTPDDPDSVWKSPGPSAGPFEAELGDGSIVTYQWYRFIDQPAIRHWGFSEEQLTDMQSNVERIHRAWGPDQTYLAPPSVGELANLDPAVVVVPPAGLDVGYVPIVTRQELAAG